MAESRLRHRHPQFPHRWELILAYRCKTPFCPLLQEKQTPAQPYRARLVGLGLSRRNHECRRIRFSCWCADLQLLDRYSGELIRELVYLWASGGVLDLRYVGLQRRHGSVEEKGCDDGLERGDVGRGGLHLRGGDVRHDQADRRCVCDGEGERAV